VGRYFHNYDQVSDWHLVPGFVDRRPALLVRDPDNLSARPKYFVLLEWAGDRLVNIRDFRHAPYVAEDAELVVLD
jgi:RNA polymerase sigma-70 factor, ECF subfamily